MTCTVLVVDDDPDFLEMMDLVLSPQGYRVEVCDVPSDAYQRAKTIMPDALIVDLVMPGLGGWGVIEQLRADPSLASTKVLVCTAAVMRASQQYALLRQWGCDILLKPFELDELMSKLDRAAAKEQAS